MIKIKISNIEKGRNEMTFRPLLFNIKYFSEIGIQFVREGSYDFEFIGMADFINKKIPLEDSIKYGLDNLSKNTGDYFLFDGSDSTSIMGAYEVFTQSNALYLFKSAMTSRENYSIPSQFNKWFFGSTGEFNLSYNIPQNIYDKIKLNGWNFGYYNPDYLKFLPINENKDIDVCAIYLGNHPENYCHNFRDDIAYTNHRTKVWDILKINKSLIYKTEKRPYPEFIDIMSRSKCTISPFGQGELCFRDFETIKFGSVMIKPNMDKVITHPNIYIPYETYIPCSLDFSDLIDKINWVKDNPKKCKEIILNARKVISEKYTGHNLVLHWHNILSNLKQVTYE